MGLRSAGSVAGAATSKTVPGPLHMASLSGQSDFFYGSWRLRGSVPRGEGRPALHLRLPQADSQWHFQHILLVKTGPRASPEPRGGKQPSPLSGRGYEAIFNPPQLVMLNVPFSSPIHSLPVQNSTKKKIYLYSYHSGSTLLINIVAYLQTSFFLKKIFSVVFVKMDYSICSSII